MKKELSVWSILAVIAAALVVVGFIFIKGGNGDASKDELTKIRQNQRNMSGSAPPNPYGSDNPATNMRR